MTYTINNDKLNEVVTIFNTENTVQIDAGEAQGHLLYDWDEGMEHQEWMDEAPAAQIADWLVQFYC